jgi:hypothetical protein
VFIPSRKTKFYIRRNKQSECCSFSTTTETNKRINHLFNLAFTQLNLFKLISNFSHAYYMLNQSYTLYVVQSKKILTTTTIIVIIIIIINSTKFNFVVRHIHFDFKLSQCYECCIRSFWVIPRRLNFICRRSGTLCLFHLSRWCKQEGTSGLHHP